MVYSFKLIWLRIIALAEAALDLLKREDCREKLAAYLCGEEDFINEEIQ